MCHHAVMNHTDVQKAHGFVMCWLSCDWLVSSWKLIDTSNLVASKLCQVSLVLNKTNLPIHPPYLVLTQLGHKKRSV
jgi:hypothetical protein